MNQNHVLKTPAGHYYLHHNRIYPVRRRIRHDDLECPQKCTAKCPVNGRNIGSAYCQQCWNFIEKIGEYIICIE